LALCRDAFELERTANLLAKTAGGKDDPEQSDFRICEARLAIPRADVGGVPFLAGKLPHERSFDGFCRNSGIPDHDSRRIDGRIAGLSAPIGLVVGRLASTLPPRDQRLGSVCASGRNDMIARLTGV
jgi:hypothetical protein